MGKKINDILIKLNKIIGINVLKWTKGGIFISLPLILKSLFALTVSVIFTRVVSKSVFGEYQFFLVLMNTFIIFSLPDMSAALIQSVARGYDKSLEKTVKYKFLGSIIGSIILFGVAVYLNIINQNSWKYYLFAAIFFPFFYSFVSCFIYLIGKQKFYLYSKYFSIQIILINLFLIASIILTKNLNIIIITFLIVNSVTGYLFYKIIRKKFIDKIETSQEDKGLFKFGFHLTLISFIPAIFTQADKIILTAFLGFEALAIYAIASSIPGQIRLIIKPLIKMVLPKLSTKTDVRKIYLFLKSKLIYMIIFPGLILSVGALLIPFVIKILFPSSYFSAIPYAQVLFFSNLFMMSSQIFNEFLHSQKKVKSILKIKGISNFLRVLFLFSLVPILGIWGVVITKILSGFFAFGLNFYYSWKESKTKIV